MLVDTGWPGNSGRDAERIETAMKDAGITQIDKVLITHFHVDHIGIINGSEPLSTHGGYRLRGITEIAEELPMPV